MPAIKFKNSCELLVELCKLLQIDKPVRSLTLHISMEDVPSVKVEYLMAADEQNRLEKAIDLFHGAVVHVSKTGCPKCGSNRIVEGITPDGLYVSCKDCSYRVALTAGR